LRLGMGRTSGSLRRWWP